MLLGHLHRAVPQQLALARLVVDVGERVGDRRQLLQYPCAGAFGLILQGTKQNFNVSTLGGTAVAGRNEVVGACAIISLPPGKNFFHSIATKFANNAQNAGIPNDGSLIGTGLRLDGQGKITVPGSSSLAWIDGAALSWSAWIKLTATQPDATIFSRQDGAKGSASGWITQFLLWK